MKYINEKAPSVKSKVKDINKKISKLVSKKEDAISKAKEMADSEEPSGKMQASLAKIQLRQSESEAEKLMLQKQAEILKAKIDTAKKKEKTTDNLGEMENRPITMLEGVMSNIHLLANASKDFEDFKKKFKKDYKKIFQNTPDFMDWLYNMYKDMAPLKAGEKVEEAKPGPDPYMRGLDDDEEEKKEDKMKKQAEMDDDDPDAYKELPGDKEAKAKGEVKTSKHVKKYHELYGDKKDESVVNEEKAEGDRGKIADANIEKALKTKSEETGVPIGLIRIVMRRGMAAWKTGHRPGATEQQWGYARVNAFLTKGEGTWGGADKDVAKEVRDGGHDKGLKERIESDIRLSDKVVAFKTDDSSFNGQSPNTITCNKCTWTWMKQDGGDDMYVCHKCGTNNAPLLGESTLNEEDTYNDYPAAAKKNAKKALDWRDEHGRDEVDAGTAVGWTRANQLAKGEKISADTVKRMASFNRHRKNSSIKAELKGTPWKDKGYVSWLIWGGDEGVDWAMKKSKEIDNMKNESKQMKYIKPLHEANRAEIHKAAKKGSYPITIVITNKGGRFDGEVAHQETVDTPEAVPAAMKVLYKKYATWAHTFAIEDSTGKVLFQESVQVNEAKIKVTKDKWPYLEFKVGGKKHKVEFDYEDIIDDHGNEGQDQYWIGKDDEGQEWMIDVYANYMGDVEEVHYDTIVKESVSSEFSPMGYAKRVVSGAIKIKDAMKEAGISLANMAKLIKRIDKSFDVDAAFLEKNVMQDDPEKFNESKSMKYIKPLSTINEGKEEDEARAILQDLLGEWDPWELSDMLPDDARETVAAYGHKGKKAEKIATALLSMAQNGEFESTVNEDYSQRARNFRVNLRTRLEAMKKGEKISYGKLAWTALGNGNFKDSKGRTVPYQDIVEDLKYAVKPDILRHRGARGADMVDAYLTFESKVNEGYWSSYEYDKWTKENGKPKYPKWVRTTLKEIVKGGFMEPVYDAEHNYMVLWLASLENKNRAELYAYDKKGEKALGKVGYAMYQRFYNDLTGYNMFFMQGAMYALEVSKNIKDRVANGEPVEPAYYMMKEYFNNFGMDTKRSRVFNAAYEKLEKWMKENSIPTL